MNLTIPDECMSANIKKLENIFKLQASDFICETRIISGGKLEDF